MSETIKKVKLNKTQTYRQNNYNEAKSNTESSEIEEVNLYNSNHFTSSSNNDPEYAKKTAIVRTKSTQPGMKISERETYVKENGDIVVVGTQKIPNKEKNVNPDLNYHYKETKNKIYITYDKTGTKIKEKNYVPDEKCGYAEDYPEGQYTYIETYYDDGKTIKKAQKQFKDCTSTVYTDEYGRPTNKITKYDNMGSTEVQYAYEEGTSRIKTIETTEYDKDGNRRKYTLSYSNQNGDKSDEMSSTTTIYDENGKEIDTRISNTYHDENNNLVVEFHLAGVASVKTTYDGPKNNYDTNIQKEEFFDKNRKPISEEQFLRLKYEHESIYKEYPPYLKDINFDVEEGYREEFKKSKEDRVRL